MALCGALLLAAGCGAPGRGPEPGLSAEVVLRDTLVPGENRLGLRVSSPGRADRSLVAYLALTSPSGERLRAEARWRAPGGAPSWFELPFQVREPGLHRGGLTIYDAERGALLHRRDGLRLMVRPRLELDCDRSYYTTEEVIRFRARVNGPAGSGHTLMVELAAADTSWARTELVVRGQKVQGEFRLAPLPLGTHFLGCRLYGGEGLADSVTVPVRKLPAAPREIKIDRFTQALLRDGEPFFPVGLYWLRAEDLGEVKRLKFNAGDYYYKLEPDEIAELMDKAAQEGIDILLELSDFVRRPGGPDGPGIRAAVERYRRHPALLAWYLIDEPTETGVEARHTRAAYRQVRELDPYHPVYLVNNRPHAYADHIDASDILGIDVYPIPNYPITRVREYMQEARGVSLGRKPVWLVAQAFGGVEHWPRSPTPGELRNMVYQGLVQGARGVLFYRYCREDERHIQPPELWREVRTLAAELADLAPALVAPDWGDGAGVVEGGKPVDVMLKAHEGAFYLLAVNYSARIQDVRLRASALPVFSRVEALHRTPLPRLAAGRLEVTLGPLGVGVYRLEPAGI